MNRLKKLIVPALALSLAVGATVPAYADQWHGGGGGDVRAQIAQLDRRIDEASRQHQISPREANGLQRQVRNLQQQQDRLARGGLSNSERRALDQRIDGVNRQIDREIADHNGHRR